MLEHVYLGDKRSYRYPDRKENPLSLETLFCQMSRGGDSKIWLRIGAEKSFYKRKEGFISTKASLIYHDDRGGKLDSTKRLAMVANSQGPFTSNHGHSDVSLCDLLANLCPLKGQFWGPSK